MYYDVYTTVQVAQWVKNLPAMQETQFDLWVGKIPLEKEMATHSSIFAWRNTWTKEPGRLQSMGSQSQTQLSDEHLNTYYMPGTVLTLEKQQGTKQTESSPYIVSFPSSPC